jgi:taurine dioxygenase
MSASSAVQERTDYQTITVTPMQGALGAEISSIDASRPLSEQAGAEMRQALLDYQVLAIRGQDLTPEQHLAFAREFGEIETYPFAEHIPGIPGVVAITKEPTTELNFGGVWHSDSPYMERPPMGTVLYGVDIPPTGGDTLFADMYAAYDALSDGMKELLGRQTGVFSACCVQMNDNLKLGDVVRRKDPVLAMAQQHHPMVRTHPETGRKSLFISRVHVQGFDRMNDAEAAPILDYLAEFATQERFTMRFKWEKGSLLLWDNRCVSHYALNDYQGYRREVHRVVLKGSQPC